MATKWISPTWRMPDEQNQSKFDNYSLNFDGTEFIDLGDNFDNVFTSDNWSVSAWIYATANTSYDNFFNKGTQVQFYLYANKLQLYLAPANTSGVWPLHSTATLSLNTWYNIVFTRSGTENKLYINGVLDNSATSTGSIVDEAAVLNIGSYDAGARYYWEGKLNDYSIFDYTLSQDQINYLYNSNTPQNPMAISGNAPIAYYPLGGSSTGDAAVSSPSTLTVPNESVPSATVFDFLAAPTYSRISLGTSDFIGNKSISFWLNKNANNGSVFAFGNTNYYPNVQSTTLQLNNGSTTVLSTGTINLNEWNHYVITGDGTTAKCYVNGVYKSTGTDRDISSAANWIGGQNNGTGMLNGELSNIQKWNAVLSDGGASIGDIAGGSISTLYNNGVPLLTGTQPQAANLKAWYPMNVGNANWAADTASDWQIADAVSTYPQSFDFGEANTGSKYITTTYFPNGETNFTYSTWLNCDFYQRGTQIAAYGGSTHENLLIAFWTDTGGAMYVYVGGVYGLFSNFSLHGYPGNEWTNISIVYDGTFTNADTATQNAGRLKLYINGNYEAFNAFGGTIPSTIPSGNTGFYLGTMTPTTYEYGGKMSNVMLFDSSLPATGTESITTLYNNGVPLTSAIATSNLKAWYKLDNTATFSTNWSIPDASGNGNTGTSSGMTEQNLVNNNVSALNGTSSGMTTANLVNSDLTRSIPYSSYSMSFDGAAEDIRCGNSLGSSLSQADYVTVSCWVYFNDITDEQGLWNFRSGDNTNDTGTSLSLYDSGATLRLAYYEGGNNGYVTISNPGLSNENWYNIVCIYDKGAAGKIYINGQAQTVVDSGVYSTVDFSSDNFYIGSYYSSTYATNGKLSNIAVWNLELTSDKVLTVYNGGVPNDISSLSPIRWWSLSGDSYFDGNNFICPNLTSSSNNGTSHNLGSTDLIGNGPGSTANGIATSMNIPENLKGNAPNSTKNAFSVNMTEIDRVLYDAEAIAFINAAGITDATQQSAIKTLVSSLQSNNLWTNMKAIYPMVGGAATTHMYNLKDPQDTDAAFRLTFSGGWTHSATGATPNGTNAGADTYFIPNDQFSSFNAMAFGYYSRDTSDVAALSYDMGLYQSTKTTGILINFVNRFYYSLNQSNYEIPSNTHTDGFFVANRSGASAIEAYRNGSPIDTGTDASTASGATISMQVGRFGGGNYLGNKECAFAFIYDGSLDATQNSNLYNAVQAFNTTLGRQV